MIGVFWSNAAFSLAWEWHLEVCSTDVVYSVIKPKAVCNDGHIPHHTEQATKMESDMK